MHRRSRLARVALAALLVAGGLYAVRGRGIRGGDTAVAAAREALLRLGFEAAGDAEVSLEGDHGLAWALERSVEGAPGQWLARGEGGAVRWRVRFSGGGEAVVTPTGTLWSVTRPVPTDPGPDLFPVAAAARVEESVARLVRDSRAWDWQRTQTWREGGHTRYRSRFVDVSGVLPGGWRRELELELVGSVVVSARHLVLPLGTDLGVVRGRSAELGRLRLAGLVGLAIATVGVLLAGAEATAFHERLAPVKGALVGVAAFGLAGVAGALSAEVAVWALAAAATVTLLPAWAYLPSSRARWGAVGGVVLATMAVSSPEVIAHLGGWIPRTPPFPADAEVLHLVAQSWLPALLEEPILRGAVPGLLTPFLGWWGAGLAGAAFGAVLHPVPSVPMVASLGTELTLQVGLLVVARFSGVGGAILARGVLDGIVMRGGYPAGAAGDLASLSGVALGAVLLALHRRKE